jgi:hypothetical protein
VIGIGRVLCQMLASHTARAAPRSDEVLITASPQSVSRRCARLLAVKIDATLHRIRIAAYRGPQCYRFAE